MSKETAVSGIKLVLRGLPYKIDEAALKEQLGEYSEEPLYSYFSTPNPFLDYRTRPFFVVAFAKEEDALSFADRFNGFVFVDFEGSSASAVVELASNNVIPKSSVGDVAKDPELGKVIDSKEYKIFVAKLEEISPQLTVDQQLKLIEERNARRTTNEMTPLTKYMLDQHLQKFKKEELRRKRVAADRKARRENVTIDFDATPEDKAPTGKAKGKELLEFVKSGPKASAPKPVKDKFKPKVPKEAPKPKQTTTEKPRAEKPPYKTPTTSKPSTSAKPTTGLPDRVPEPKSKPEEAEKEVQRPRVPEREAPVKAPVEKKPERKPRVEREIYRPGRLRKAKEEAERGPSKPTEP